MLAYVCKNCGRFTVLGYENDYDEHFCTQDCYRKYCEKNNYTYKSEDLIRIKNVLTK